MEKKLSTDKQVPVAAKQAREQTTKSFKEALTKKLDEISNDRENVVVLKNLPQPRMEGGNIVIEIDEEDYRKGVDELWFSVVEKLTLHKGETSPMPLELKRKLQLLGG